MFGGPLILSITYLYVVLLVVLTHQAVVKLMPTAAAPLNTMAERRRLLPAGGKFLVKFSVPQSSNRKEKKAKTGMERRLL